jgi:hypothetical protein
MASLTTLQGRGGGRIPTNTTSYDLNRHQLTALVRKIAADLYPTKRYSAAMTALQAHPDAARLIREAAVAYTTEQ